MSNCIRKETESDNNKQDWCKISLTCSPPMDYHHPLSVYINIDMDIIYYQFQLKLTIYNVFLISLLKSPLNSGSNEQNFIPGINLQIISCL